MNAQKIRVYKGLTGWWADRPSTGLDYEAAVAVLCDSFEEALDQVREWDFEARFLS